LLHRVWGAISNNMATAKKTKRPKTPREKAPKLIGLTPQEAATLERAAKICGIPCAQFIRESALANAATVGAK